MTKIGSKYLTYLFKNKERGFHTVFSWVSDSFHSIIFLTNIQYEYDTTVERDREKDPTTSMKMCSVYKIMLRFFDLFTSYF